MGKAITFCLSVTVVVEPRYYTRVDRANGARMPGQTAQLFKTIGAKKSFSLSLMARVARTGEREEDGGRHHCLSSPWDLFVCPNFFNNTMCVMKKNQQCIMISVYLNPHQCVPCSAWICKMNAHGVRFWGNRGTIFSVVDALCRVVHPSPYIQWNHVK